MSLLLIDGLNLFLRNYAVNPQMDVNGDHIGGAVGFLRCLKCYIRDFSVSRAVVVWDGKGGSQKRRGIYAEYKAGRKPRMNRAYDFGESPEAGERNLATQLLKTKRYVELLGVTQIEIEGIEADDTIAYLCYAEGDSDKVVVSTDRDFLQLVGPTTKVYSPVKKILFGSDQVKEVHLVLPENYVYSKALTGDASDNISGVKGVGEKTVLKLFPFLAERPSTLQEVLDHARDHAHENPKYRAIHEQCEIVTANVRLMQLSSPIIGVQSASSIRHTISQDVVEPVMSEVRLSFLRDGIQLTDSDFFAVFREYHHRRAASV